MKFNLFFTLKGPAGTVELANKHNPVEAENIVECLRMVAVCLPESKQLQVECVGIRVEQVEK